MSVRLNALHVPCPVCQAKEGHSCTAPTNTGRRSVSWFHHARESFVAEPTALLAERIAEEMGTQNATLTCMACAWTEGVYPDDVAAVRELIEHCAFDHKTRAAMQVTRVTEYLSGWDLGKRLNLGPVTEEERRWREGQA